MEVGQIVYVKRGHRDGSVEILELPITKVGTKYFYIKKDWNESPIDKKTLWHRNKTYSQNDFKVFLEKQDIIDAEEKRKLCDSLYKAFDGYRSSQYTLEQLRQVAAIINL